MDFRDQLQAISARLVKQKEFITTEEATKNAFVMPFINALGYDVFDPSEVIPEFTADVGSKKGEKVDYAVYIDGKPTMLFECKTCTCDLHNVHASQLRRYFHVTDARIGVLTNGCNYMFFSDLEEPNKMDKKPFMEINLLDIDTQLIPELKKLAKSTFELDQMLSTANNLKYTREVKVFLNQQLKQPSPEFVKMAIADAYTGLKTQSVIEQFTPIVRQAFLALINDNINERLKTALGGQEEPETNGTETVSEKECRKSGIVTTDEEMEGYYIIRAILRNNVDISRVTHRDTKSYMGILLDDNNRKPICRLHFNTVQKYIGLPNREKKETRYPISSLSDIYSFTDQIRDVVNFLDDGVV